MKRVKLDMGAIFTRILFFCNSISLMLLNKIQITFMMELVS